jgi:quinol-cytochrome oxidoreductase complex cytochrome b subunit
MEERAVSEHEAHAEPTTRRGAAEEQFGITGMTKTLVKDYMIPAETNTVWYALGGVLTISLMLEMVTGALLLLRYEPTAGAAYQSTKAMLSEPGWSWLLNFHYFNSYLIFGLVMVHMMRVFISAAYRGAKKGLWTVGVALAGLVFVLSTTGETLHWDERGFAVPWHIAELFQAVGLADTFHWTRADMLNITNETHRLIPLYALHVAILPLLLVLVLVWHYYLVKVKHIGVPFWHRPTGRTTPFSHHIRAWAIYGTPLIGAMVLLAAFVHREAGPAPQLLKISPYYGSPGGPGHLGAKPTFPIGWTHGMNVFSEKVFGLNPDIWGTVIGMALMSIALLVIPLVDRGKVEPGNWRSAFDMRTRGWAFLAMLVFWVVMIIGVVTNIVTGPA